MNKIILFFFFSMLLNAAASAQTKPVKKGDTKQLPDCVLIKDGKLQAKAGYTVTVSPDGKTFTVSKRNGIGGTFNCACGGNTTGDCAVFVGTGGIMCKGGCSCSITVVVSGVTYAVDLSAGLLRKS